MINIDIIEWDTTNVLDMVWIFNDDFTFNQQLFQDMSGKFSDEYSTMFETSLGSIACD